MFKKKDLESLLGVGSVRAPLTENEQPDTPITESVDTLEPDSTEESAASPMEEPPAEAEPEEKSQSHHTPDPNQQLISAYENQIAFLQQQLLKKDEQLNSKDDIIKNFQVLLKLEQDTVLKLTHQIEETPKQSGWRHWFHKKKPDPAAEEQ